MFQIGLFGPVEIYQATQKRKGSPAPGIPLLHGSGAVEINDAEQMARKAGLLE